jgi:hypothetical protein
MHASHGTLGSFMGILLPLALCFPALALAVPDEAELAIKGYEHLRHRGITKLANVDIESAVTEFEDLVPYAQSELPASHWAVLESRLLRDDIRAIANLNAAEKQLAQEMLYRWGRGAKYHDDGKYALCVPELAAAVELADKLQLSDTMIQSRIVALLGVACHHLKDHSRAIDCARRSLAILESHRLASSVPAANVRLNLVKSLVKADRLFEADRECHRVHQAWAEIEKVPHDTEDMAWGVGVLLDYRSGIHFAFNELAEAQECEVSMLHLAEECLMILPTPTLRASAQIASAHCKALCGNLAGAARDVEVVDNLVKSIKDFDPGQNGLYRLRRAEIMTLAGRLEEAQVDLHAAEQLFLRATGPTGPWVARHQFATAQLLLAQGELAKGRATMRESVDALLANYGPDAPTLIRVLVVAEKEEQADGNQQRAGELAAIRTRLERRVAEHRQAMNAEFGPLPQLQTTQGLPAGTPVTAAVRPVPNPVAPASAARPGTAPRTR